MRKCICCKIPMKNNVFEVVGTGSYSYDQCPKCGLIVYNHITGKRLHPRDLSNYRKGLCHDGKRT